MKRFVYGKVTLFQEECPVCKEVNLSKNQSFVCSSCSTKYGEKKADQTIIVVTEKRQKCPQRWKKIITAAQDGRCFWCNRLIGKQVVRGNRVIKLTPRNDGKRRVILIRNDFWH